MKSILYILLLSVFLAASATPMDSIGVEKKNGKTYVLHKVDMKESLYSISRKYGAKVDEIRAANPEMKTDELKVGQIILVPSRYQSGSSASNGKSYTVQKKESYYSIAKKYSVEVEALKKANPGKDPLKSGDVLAIPAGTSAPTTREKQETSTIDNGNYKIHKVEAKETLYGISKAYGVEVDAIKKLNPELEAGLKTDMELKIPNKSSVVPSKKKELEKAVAKNTEAEKKKKEDETPKPKVVEETKSKTTRNPEEPRKEPKEEIKPEALPESKQKETTIVTNESTSETVPTKTGFDKIEQKGMAELLENKSDSPKFQALHRTASAGTIIQVINQNNGQKIFVRVIGKLEGGDSAVVIKLSQRAMERLQASGNKIPVNLSYIP